MKRYLVVAALVITAIIGFSLAGCGPVGRYQVIQTPINNTSATLQIIKLDTVTGKTWRYWDFYWVELGPDEPDNSPHWKH